MNVRGVYKKYKKNLPRYEGQSFTIEIFFPKSANYTVELRQTLLGALHDFPEIQNFTSERILEGFSAYSIKGEKNNIYFSVEANGTGLKVILHPYIQ